MNTSDVMREYIEYERKNINSFNGSQESCDGIVRFVSNDRHGSYISYFNFSQDNSELQIAQQLRYFKERNLSFEWKTYSTDLPRNIGEYLIKSGFDKEETESFMALDLKTAETKSFDNALITEVVDSKGIRDAIRVQEEVWGGDFEWQHDYLLALKESSPESVSIYVVYVEGRPVTSAWITFNGKSPFAGIWGGSTVKEFRGNGYYSLLLNKRIQEAKSRGMKYLIIDASEMSRPIVESYGFKFIASTTGYTSPNS